IFLDNILANLSRFPRSPTEEIWQLFVWAYQEALVLKRDRDAERLEQILKTGPLAPQQLATIAARSVYNRLERQPSPMGRLALNSANHHLSQAELAAASWKDAGMISLGFFRILELEFNERLIFPMMKTVDFKTLEDEYEKLTVSVERQIDKKASEFWQRM